MILTDQERAAVQLELAGGPVGLAERLVLLGMRLGLERAAKTCEAQPCVSNAESDGRLLCVLAIREAAKD